MRKYTFFAFLLFVASSLSAQLVNDGGMIVIQPGATLVVEGDIDNGSGMITNNGTIKVQDDFTNSASLVSGAASEIIFTGDMVSNFTTGGAELAIVRNEKTTSDVVLMDNMTVAEAVDFIGTSNIVLGANSVTLSDGVTTNGDAATGWFVTDGTGVVERKTDAAGTADFHVGDAANFSPLSVIHSGTYTPGVSQISAKATNTNHPNLLADADSYISRYWSVNSTDITGFSGEMEGTFVPGDVNGTGDIVGARYEASEWEFATGTSTMSTVTATTNSEMSDLTGKNFYGKADLTLFLQSAYASASTMGLGINSVIPLASPYLDAPATAPSIPANAVDWIKIETRDPALSTAVTAKFSAFLLSDGSVVSVDGSSLPLIKDVSSGYVAIFHRNHLPVRSSNVIDMATVSNYSFSSLANVYNDAGVPNDPMIELETGIYGLIGGDTNGDGFVRYTDGFIPPVTFIDSDATEVFSALGNISTGQLSGYYQTDVNMDGFVRYTDGFVPPVTFIDSDATEVFSILGNVSSSQFTQNID